MEGRGEGEEGLLREGGLNIGFTVSIETVTCRLSVATDGKHGHGLKLEKRGPIIISKIQLVVYYQCCVLIG